MSYKQMNETGASAPALPPRDPFYVVKEKVQDMIGTLTVDFDRWKELLETTNTASSKEFAPLTQSIKVAIKKLNIDLNDLSQTIAIVSANRARFAAIDDKELDARKKFVNDMKALVSDCEETLASVRTKSKLERDQRDHLFAAENAERRTAKQKEVERDASDFLDGRQQAQVDVQKQQDAVLDDMSSALDRLGAMSSDIHTELKVHDTMLTEMDDDMTATQTTMNKVLRKVDKLLGQSDTGRLCCIFFLFICVIILIIMLIYM